MLDEKTINFVSRFTRSNGISIPTYYRNYEWGEDRYCNGFPRILCLEEKFYKSRKERLLKERIAREVVLWGVPRWASRFRLGGSNHSIDLLNVEGVTNILERVERGIITGRGPAIVSKILRFLIPEDFGVIDTKLVRVFGKSGKHPWLKLRANSQENAVYTNRNVWPSEYFKWLEILKCIAVKLEELCIYPPYPLQWERFIKRGLRVLGKWYCADVEMALWRYASDVLKDKKKRKIRCR